MKPAITLLAAGAMLGAGWFAWAEDRDSVRITPRHELQEKDSLPGDADTPSYKRGDETRERGTTGRSTQSDDTTRARDKNDVVRDLKGLHDGDDVTRSR